MGHMSGLEKLTVYFNAAPEEMHDGMVESWKVDYIQSCIEDGSKCWKEDHAEWDMPVSTRSLARSSTGSEAELSWDEYISQVLDPARKFMHEEDVQNDEVKDESERDQGIGGETMGDMEAMVVNNEQAESEEMEGAEDAEISNSLEPSRF